MHTLTWTHILNTLHIIFHVPVTNRHIKVTHTHTNKHTNTHIRCRPRLPRGDPGVAHRQIRGIARSREGAEESPLQRTDQRTERELLVAQEIARGRSADPNVQGVRRDEDAHAASAEIQARCGHTGSCSLSASGY